MMPKIALSLSLFLPAEIIRWPIVRAVDVADVAADRLPQIGRHVALQAMEAPLKTYRGA